MVLYKNMDSKGMFMKSTTNVLVIYTVQGHQDNDGPVHEHVLFV